uniref:hypothetical protein n=1 Tax=uncultured Bilophila sp. TaxID=529385 RepID=UPI0025D1C1F0|nr:hypothetical protein [uncultured Bilophila sp.]
MEIASPVPEKAHPEKSGSWPAKDFTEVSFVSIVGQYMYHIEYIVYLIDIVLYV